MTEPFILTLKLDDAAFAHVNGLRQQHFPPERNFIPAHVTLFHALPPEHEAQIRADLQELCAQTAPFVFSLPRVRFLGRGVALDIDSSDLHALRKQLAHCWQPWLGTQDSQGFRPHITVQNKVAPNEARQLFDQLTETWTPLSATAEGLLLWRYLGGPWERVDKFDFALTN